MAIHLESEGALIAKIQYKNKSNDKNGFSNYECNKDETLQLVPNNKAERTCAYICWQSGSGKSFFYYSICKRI